MASKFESSVQKASDIIYDYPCTHCEEDDLNAEASYFCGQCVKLYCNECAKAHGQFFKKHQLLGRKDVSRWGSVTKDVRGEMCDLHPGNAIQMYCRDHDVVCCTVCVSVKHRPCKAVDHVPDVAKGIYKDADFNALPAKVTKVQTKLNKKQGRKKKNRTVLQECCKKVVTSMKELRKRVNKMMDQLEKSTVEEMDRLLAIFDATLESDIDTCARIHDDLKQFLDKLQDKGMKSETDGYICYKKCQHKMSEADDLLKTMPDEEYEIKFQIDPQIEQYLSSLQTIGQFQTSPAVQINPPAPGKTSHSSSAIQTNPPAPGKTSPSSSAIQTNPPAPGKTSPSSPAIQTNPPAPGKTSPSSPAIQTNPPAPGKTSPSSPAIQTNPPAPGKTSPSSPAIQTNPPAPGKTSDTYTVQDIQKYSVKTTSNKKTCNIRGSCQLPNGNLVVADYYNDNVKQLDDRFAVIAQCGLPGEPRDICHIADMEVVVALSGSAFKGIQFIMARNGKLELGKNIKLDHDCKGIAHHNDKLYVSSGTALYIYTLAGKLEKKIYEDKSGGTTVYKFSVAVDGRRIYVTNWSKNLLITLDDQGNQLASLSDPDLQNPTGVCVASNGTVLVCGHGSCTVVQFDCEGKKKLTTVARKSDGVDCPWSLMFNRRTSQLIVGQYSGEASLLALTLK